MKKCNNNNNLVVYIIITLKFSISRSSLTSRVKTPESDIVAIVTFMLSQSENINK